MKIALSLAGLALAQGFTQSPMAGRHGAVKMSEEVAEAEAVEEVAEPEPEPEPVAAPELFGKAPFVGGELFLGETEWEKFTTEYGSAETGTFLRAAELKHGRSAMVATVGFALQKLGVTFDKISPHEYLSVSQNIKFADLAAMGPVAAIKAVPAEGFAQIFGVIAAIEIYELTHRDGEIKQGDSVAPGLQAGGLTGYNLNYNPLKVEITDRRKLVELQNGRAAMFAISAWVAAETIPGSVPIPLLW